MLFKFEPIYKERVWGGDMLTNLLGRRLPTGKKIGESWDVVDRDDISSKIINSARKGLTLRELIYENPDQIIGPKWPKNKNFPILVKWLDCSERLSLQVHPPSNIAEKLDAEPKTENWYIAHAQPKSCLFAGFVKGTTKEDFQNAIKDSSVERLCHSLTSKEGDSILIKSGRIHAIGGGNLILEIQQNSDSTFRVYDWDRVGLDGRRRKLHISESILSINFQDYEPKLNETLKVLGEEIIADCESFRIRKFNTSSGTEFILKDAGEDCAMIHVISGSLNVETEHLKISEHGLSPYCAACKIKSNEESTFLVTDKFNFIQ